MVDRTLCLKGPPPTLRLARHPRGEALQETANGKSRREAWEGLVQGLPALYLLLHLLHLVANLPSHRARLPHLGEQGCHLVTAQEAGGTAPQLMQEASLHRTWATKGSSS